MPNKNEIEGLENEISLDDINDIALDDEFLENDSGITSQGNTPNTEMIKEVPQENIANNQEIGVEQQETVENTQFQKSEADDTATFITDVQSQDQPESPIQNENTLDNTNIGEQEVNMNTTENVTVGNTQDLDQINSGKSIAQETQQNNAGEEFSLSAMGVGINTKEEVPVENTQDEKLVDFSYKKKEKKSNNRNYKKLGSKINTFALILLFIVMIIGGYYAYMIYAPQDNLSTNKSKYVETVRNARGIVNNYIPVDKTTEYTDSTIYNDFYTILESSDLGYIDKKFILEIKMKDFINKLSQEKQTLEDNKGNITKYAYLPREISVIIGEDDAINSIEDSLFALEAIKFNSAVSVFMHLDSFTRNLSKAVSTSREKIKDNMDYIKDKGGKDINLYIKKCYLNPFETNYDCNVIGDYDRYSRLFENDGDKKVDKRFFKKMMYYIDLKLERTELPSFNIVFQRFDKNNDNITFTIDINTLKQDELELSKAGIFEDPVMFIMDKLINNLKRSRFIKGNDIKIPTLSSKSKKIKVGVTEFVVNTISKTFKLPIQKDAEREIYDFVDQGM